MVRKVSYLPIMCRRLSQLKSRKSQKRKNLLMYQSKSRRQELKRGMYTISFSLNLFAVSVMTKPCHFKYHTMSCICNKYRKVPKKNMGSRVTSRSALRRGAASKF